jgi:hypothetical protein
MSTFAICISCLKEANYKDLSQAIYFGWNISSDGMKDICPECYKSSAARFDAKYPGLSAEIIKENRARHEKPKETMHHNADGIGLQWDKEIGCNVCGASKPHGSSGDCTTMGSGTYHNHDCKEMHCAQCMNCAHLAQPGYDPVTDTGDLRFDEVRRETIPSCSFCNPNHDKSYSEIHERKTCCDEWIEQTGEEAPCPLHE